MLGLGVRTGYSYKGRGGGHGHPTGLPRLHPALGLCFDMTLEHSTPRLVHTPIQLHPPLPALLCPLTSLPSKPHGATALAAAKFSSQVTQDKELLKHPPMPAVLCPLGKGPPHFRKLVSELSPLCTHPASTWPQGLVQNPETQGPASVPWPLPASRAPCLGMGNAPSLWEGAAGDHSLNKFFGTSKWEPPRPGLAGGSLPFSHVRPESPCTRLRHFPALQDSDTRLDNHSSPSEALGFASPGSGPCWGRHSHSVIPI